MSDINKIKFKLHEDLEAELISSKVKEENKENSDGEVVSESESEVN